MVTFAATVSAYPGSSPFPVSPLALGRQAAELVVF